MRFLKSSEYLEPGTVEEAFQLLSDYDGRAKVLTLTTLRSIECSPAIQKNYTVLSEAVYQMIDAVLGAAETI